MIPWYGLQGGAYSQASAQELGAAVWWSPGQAWQCTRPGCSRCCSCSTVHCILQPLLAPPRGRAKMSCSQVTFPFLYLIPALLGSAICQLADGCQQLTACLYKSLHQSYSSKYCNVCTAMCKKNAQPQTMCSSNRYSLVTARHEDLAVVVMLGLGCNTILALLVRQCN